MAAEGVSGLQGAEMDRAAIDAFLTERGHGVLSLAREGEAYGIPVSFGYDGERLYFVFQRPGETSRKEVFAGTTTRASFLAYEALDTDDWRSVVVEGPLRELEGDDWTHAVETLADNAWYPDLFSKTEPMQDFLGFELVAEDLRGLRAQ